MVFAAIKAILCLIRDAATEWARWIHVLNTIHLVVDWVFLAIRAYRLKRNEDDIRWLRQRSGKTAGSLTESKPIIGSLMNMWHYRMSWRNEWLFRRQW
jgi:c-di-AMP phosphodiesterase-like protein